MQDAERYQELLEAKDRMEAIEGIDRGLESMKRNAGKAADRFFQEFFADNGIPDLDEARPSDLEDLARRDTRRFYVVERPNCHSSYMGDWSFSKKTAVLRISQNLALRWRADGNDSTLTWITLMAAHSVFIGKSMEVGSGSRPV